MPWWGWVLVLVVVLAWVGLRWLRNDAVRYVERTNGRVAMFGHCVDEVDAIVGRESFPVGALLRIEGKLDSLVDAQRSDRVPRVDLKRFNAVTIRMFEVERDLVKDLQTTGGENYWAIINEREVVFREMESVFAGWDQMMEPQSSARSTSVDGEVDRGHRALQQVMARPRKQVDVSEGQYVGTSGYDERTEARLARWDEVMDELEEILQSAEWPNGTLARLGGDLDALANEQRQERVPDGVPEWHNVGLTRLFEVDRDLIRDYRTTGGVDSNRLVGARWEFIEALELDQRGLGRHRLWVSPRT